MKSSLVDRIASEASVSPTTVRRAMRGDSRVRPSTRERIESFSRELGYRPNAMAKALKKGLRKNVGVIFACPMNHGEPWLYLQQYARYLQQLSLLLDGRGFNLLLGTARKLVTPESYRNSLPRIIDEGHVDHLIVVSHMWQDMADELRLLRVPTVVVNGPSCGLPTVQVDETKSVVTLVDRLVEHGHKHIAFVNHHPGMQSGYRDDLWPRGYFEAITKHRLAPVPGWDQFEPVDQVVDRLLALTPTPTAMIVYDDVVAQICIVELLKRGLSVPGDISVVASCDCGHGGAFRPEITRIAMPCDEMSNAALSLLESPTKSDFKSKPKVFKMPGVYCPGQTIGPAADLS